MIDKKEVLRYLGYKDNQKLDNYFEKLIDESIKEILEKYKPKQVFGFYNIKINKDFIEILNTDLKFYSKDLIGCLKGCERVVLMAVTLGQEVDRIIDRYQKTDMTKALVLDAIATAYVDSACDKIEEETQEKLKCGLSFRYSPGYGDLGLEIQSNFLSVLNTKKLIGLYANNSNLLIPRKSVTAILGIKEQYEKRNSRECCNCICYESCKFRREGISCAD